MLFQKPARLVIRLLDLTAPNALPPMSYRNRDDMLLTGFGRLLMWLPSYR